MAETIITNVNIRDLVRLYLRNKKMLPDDLKKKPIGEWNVSRVTDMSGLFAKTNFNENINDWDVSNVTNMSKMFYEASSFNQPLDKWKTGNVTNMKGLFVATKFNEDINDWDVSNVTNMEEMFYYTYNFNKPLDKWKTGNVTNMRGMFGGAKSFNQPLDNWDVSNVTNMKEMFRYAQKFNQPINDWDVSNVTNMSEMFSYENEFNQPLNKWNVSKVKDMTHMFFYAGKFNQPIGDWDVSNVTDMKNMFFGSFSFNQDLSKWDECRKQKRLITSPAIFEPVKKDIMAYDFFANEEIPLYDAIMNKTGDIYDYWVFIHRFKGTKILHYAVLDHYVKMFVNDLKKYDDNAKLDLHQLAVHAKCSFSKEYLQDVFRGELNKNRKPNLYLIEDGKNTIKFVDADEYLIKPNSPIRRPRVTRKRSLSRRFVPYKKTLNTQLATLIKEPSTRQNAIDIAATRAQLNNAATIHKEMSQIKFRNEKTPSAHKTRPKYVPKLTKRAQINNADTIHKEMSKMKFRNENIPSIPKAKTIKHMKSHSHSPRKYTRSKSRSPNQYTRSI